MIMSLFAIMGSTLYMNVIGKLFLFLQKNASSYLRGYEFIFEHFVND